MQHEHSMECIYNSTIKNVKNIQPMVSYRKF
jgi:hypothetical protein